MFEKRAQALALIAPAALFSALVFIAPVVVLLAEGFRIRWALRRWRRSARSSPRRSTRPCSGAR